MSRILKILIIFCLILNSSVKAQQDFSEIRLPETKDSDTFVEVLRGNDTPVIKGSIGINKGESLENKYSEIIPRHRLYIGQVSVYDDRSSFKNIRAMEDIGVKLKGGNGLINYSTGVYNINKAGAWASVNPIHKLPEAGELELGGGVFTNKLGTTNELNEANSLSLFTGYKFKRFSTRGELVRKDYTYYDSEYYDSWRVKNKLDITRNISLTAG